MKKHMVRGCVLSLVLTVCHGALAQTTGTRLPPLTSPSLVGRDLFEFYCATCHGRDGKGHGPVAAALKAPPPDLTQLARDNGGTFPRRRLETFINQDSGALVPSHGTSDMPVWGPIFRGLDPSDTLVKVRIDNLVDYIAAMQAK
jgi:mono/diheme cytochrome c family protein